MQNKNITDRNIFCLIDFMITGDGDYVLKELLKTINSGGDNVINNFKTKIISGRWKLYSKNKIIKSKGLPLELNQLPFMPIELADVNRHKNDFDIFHNPSGILPTIQMLAQRGCPYACNFCSENNKLAYYKSRSIESILKEIDLRKRQGFRSIFFDDSTFGAYRHDKSTLNDLLKELARTNMIFGCLNRFNLLQDRKMIRLYKKAGFQYFYCSIEQYDNQSLKNILQTSEERFKDIMVRNRHSWYSKHGYLLKSKE